MADLRSGYVVAHNKDRDFYQVALALEEMGALRALVTDYYDDGRSFSSRLFMSRIVGHRQKVPIPITRTRNCWDCVLLQIAAKLDKPHDGQWYLRTDRRLGGHTRDVAIRCLGADLLIYNSYALESFEAPELRARTKGLFVYHPHPKLIGEILRADFDRFGIGAQSIVEESDLPERVERMDREISLADRMICASSLTKRSVEFSGISQVPVSVVPYGAVEGRVGFRPDLRVSSPVRVLFVGQAIQRKGLHHLLMAWRALRPANAELVLVCSRSQDGILDDLPDGVVLRSGLSTDELERAYQSAHVFVLPALVEGFGLVLLEALQAGCHTIYSDATGLVDYEVPPEAGQAVIAGDIEGLKAALEHSIRLAASGGMDHEEIAAFAATLSAERFREGIRAWVAEGGRTA